MKLRVLTAAAGLAAGVALLGVLELLFRVAGIPDTPPEIFLSELDPYLITRTRRNLSIATHDGRAPVTTNSAGLRNRETSVRKPPGVRRVIALGDSTTFGYGAGDEETYCRRLEERLNRGGEGRGALWEVINAGTVGYTTVEGLRYLKRDLLRYEPDYVIVSFAANDSSLAWNWYGYRGRSVGEIPRGSPLVLGVRNLLYGRSSLGRWALGSLDGFLKRRWEASHAAEIGGSDKRIVTREEYLENLEEFVRIARKSEFEIVFMPAPVKLKESRTTPYHSGVSRTSREKCARSAREILEEITATRDRGKLWGMYYRLAEDWECAAERKKARRAYLDALRHADPKVDERWLALEYIDLMIRFAKGKGTPLVDVSDEIAELELSGGTAGLFADIFHVGPEGHRVIARELFRVISGMARVRRY